MSIMVSLCFNDATALGVSMAVVWLSRDYRYIYIARLALAVAFTALPLILIATESPRFDNFLVLYYLTDKNNKDHPHALLFC